MVQEAFITPPTAVATNALWFSSLLIALVCALLSTLVQEWSRNYVQDINKRQVLHEDLRPRAWNHIYIRMGVNRYGMDQFVSWIVALVHLSVFLFACGLLLFLFPINHVVAGISTSVLGLFITMYCIASLLPLLDKSCPYRTPVSYLMASIYWFSLRCRTVAQRLWPRVKDGDSRHEDDEDENTFHSIITRQYTNRHLDFMTDSRSVFAWDHTFAHVGAENHEDFLQGLPSYIISLRYNAHSLLDRFCTSTDLVDMLYWYLRENLVDIRKGSLSPSNSGVFELVAHLSRRMFALEVERFGELHLEDDVRTRPVILPDIAYVSRIAEVEAEGPSQLSARLCIAYVRWSLVQLCQKAFEKGMTPLSEPDVLGFFHNLPHSFSGLGGRHPSILLSHLITGSYSGEHAWWTHTDEVNLLPLHDDDCCKNWRTALTHEGLVHVVACNALTTVAHILEANDSQRKHARDLRSLVTGNGFLGCDIMSIQMPKHDSHKMPSSEFVSLLRSAGLQQWLDPGSKFDTEPGAGPHNDFLTMQWGFGPRCVRVLKSLAQHVDFAAYRARMVPAFPFMLPPPSGEDSPVASPAAPSQPADVRGPSQPPPPLRGANGEVERYFTPQTSGSSHVNRNQQHDPDPVQFVQQYIQSDLDDLVNKQDTPRDTTTIFAPLDPRKNDSEQDVALGQGFSEAPTDTNGSTQSRSNSEDITAVQAPLNVSHEGIRVPATIVEDEAAPSTPLVAGDETREQDHSAPQSSDLREVVVAEDRNATASSAQEEDEAAAAVGGCSSG